MAQAVWKISQRDIAELRAEGYRVEVLGCSFAAPCLNGKHILPGPYDWYVTDANAAWCAAWNHYLGVN